MHAYHEENALNVMKEKLQQSKGYTNHCLAKLEGTMFNSAQVETLRDVISGKNELMKSLREAIKNLKAQ